MSQASFLCPHCDKTYRWQADVAGRRVRCACGGRFFAPAAAGESSRSDGPLQRPAQTTPPPTDDDFYELNLPNAPPILEQRTEHTVVAETSGGGGSGGGKCPSCNSPVRAGAVLCLNCGFHLGEGQKLQTTVAADGPADEPAAPTLDEPRQEQRSRTTARMDYDQQVAADMAQVHRRQEWTAPLVIASVGALLMLLNLFVLFPQVEASYGVSRQFVMQGPVQLEALVASAVLLVLQLPCLLAGLFVIAALFGSSFGSLGSALRKLAALALLIGQIDIALTQTFNLVLYGAGGIAWMLQASMSFACFWLASKTLFDDLEVGETVGLWFASALVPGLLLFVWAMFF